MWGHIVISLFHFSEVLNKSTFEKIHDNNFFTGLLSLLEWVRRSLWYKLEQWLTQVDANEKDKFGKFYIVLFEKSNIG